MRFHRGLGGTGRDRDAVTHLAVIHALRGQLQHFPFAVDQRVVAVQWLSLLHAFVDVRRTLIVGRADESFAGIGRMHSGNQIADALRAAGP